MLINPEALNAEYWHNISYKDKTKGLLTVANNMNWSFEELASELSISEERLEALLTMEEINEDFMNKALLKLSPILEDRLQEQRANIQFKEETARKEESRNYADQIKIITRKASEHHLSLSKLMGVNQRTLDNWTKGKSKPRGLEEKVIDLLINDFDSGIELVVKIDETVAKKHQRNNQAKI